MPAVLHATALRIDQVVPVPILGGEAVGEFISFLGLPDGLEHVAVRLGRPAPDAALVRVHSECLTGDVFGSQRCDCGPQLGEALRLMAREGGYLIYLRQEGRGIGLYAKLRAYALQDRGRDTYQANLELGHPADGRDYGIAAQMLTALGVRRLTLLTNNPRKEQALRAAGLEVTRRGTGAFETAHNAHYLRAKRDQGGHRFALGALNDAEPDGALTRTGPDQG